MLRRRSAIAAGLLLLATVVPVSAAAPTNDHADGASVIDALPASVPVDLTEATVDGDPAYCGSGGASVWYRYSPASDAFLTIALAADPWMGAVHLAPDVPEAFAGCVSASQATTFAVEAGRTYYLQVTTDGSPTTMDLAATPLIANDRFDGAIDIGSLPATVTADLTASTSNGDSSACASNSNGAWYRLSPADDVTVDIQADIDQSAIVTVTGATIGDQLACHYAWNGPLRVALDGGSTYHLQMAAHSPSPSGTTMAIDPLPPAPGHDDRADALVISSLPYSDTVDLRSAHPDDTDGYCFEPDSPVVWYRITPSEAVVLHVDVSPGAQAAFFYDGAEEDATGCTSHGGDAAGLALVPAGEPVDIALAAAPWGSWPATLTLTSTPAPTYDIVVNPTGSVEKAGGTAVISGTARCSSAGDANSELSLRQTVGRKLLVRGYGYAQVDCAPTPVPWTIRVPGESAPFGTGSVSVSFNGSFGQWPMSAEDRGTTVVKLKGN